MTQSGVLDELTDKLGYELDALANKYANTHIRAYCLILDEDASTAYLACYGSDSDPVVWDYWTEWSQALSREERACLPGRLSEIGSQLIEAYSQRSKTCSDDQIRWDHEVLYVTAMKREREARRSDALYLVAHFADLDFAKRATVDINPPSALREGFLSFVDSMDA
jgi:hypothetical protein